MAKDEEQTVEAEFIPALDDATIRLQCFSLAERGAKDFASHMAQAKVLYAWVMEFEPEDADGLGVAMGEAECTRKH